MRYTEYIVSLPKELRDDLERLSRLNRRTFSAELCVAVDRYVAEKADDHAPDYEGTLQRRKVFVPVDIHETVRGIAANRGTSMNKVYMAAVNRYVAREKERT